MLEPETIAQIGIWVRSSLHNKRRMMQLFCEEMYAPGELDPDEVSAAIDAEFAKWWDEKQKYPEVTDCDRLDQAFDSMNERGVLASQLVGYTQSDGYDDFLEKYGSHPAKSSVLGYCFYHGQDYERAAQGGGLLLSFGPANPEDEDTQGILVGNIVREELERAGLAVDWDGTFAKRLSVPVFVWQRR